MTTTEAINRADWIETADGRTGKVAIIRADAVVALMDDTSKPERIALDAIYRVIPAN